MLTTLSDETHLLIKAQALDSFALGEIHDRYFPQIYRYAYSRTGDSHVAEDIAAEVFLRLLNALHDSHPPQTSLRGWLFGVASHLVVDHYRRGASVPLLEEQADGNGETSTAEQSLQHVDLQLAVLKLKPEHQEVISLRFGAGFSVEETAHQMNRSVTAIKSLQLRAVDALRQVLAEVDEDE